MSADESVAGKKGSRKGKGNGDGEPGEKKRKRAIHEEELPKEGECPGEEEADQADEGAETVPEEPGEAPVSPPKPSIAVLAEANGAETLATCVAANGHPPEPENGGVFEPSNAPKTPMFCHLTVELGPDAVRCFIKNGTQTKIVKGVILLSDDRGCRVRVLEVKFVPERSPGPEVKKFPCGFKKP